MHVLKYSKKEKPTPFVPIVSQFKVPYFRKMRGVRYNSKGKVIGQAGPPKPIPDARERENLRREEKKAAKLPPPVETEAFSLDRYSPLPGKVLCRRPPQITHDKGVELPEKLYRSEDWFFVVKVGAGVTTCQPGDRVVFGKRSRPKPVRIGQALHLGRATAIAAIIEP